MIFLGGGLNVLWIVQRDGEMEWAKLESFPQLQSTELLICTQ